MTVLLRYNMVLSEYRLFFHHLINIILAKKLLFVTSFYVATLKFAIYY